MENEEILQVVSIISVKFPTDIPSELENSPIAEKLRSLPFPQLTNFEKIADNASSTQFKTYTDFLKDISLDFAFSPEILDEINKLEYESSETEYYISNFVFLSFIFWILRYESTKSVDDVLILLKSLHKIARNEYKKRAIQIFSVVMKIYINSQHFSPENVFDLLPKILKDVNSEWHFCSKWLFTLLSILFNQTDRTLFNRFAEILNSELTKSTETILTSEFSSMSHILGRDILNLNKYSIELFANLALRAQDKLSAEFLDFVVIPSFFTTFIPLQFDQVNENPEFPELGYSLRIEYATVQMHIFDKVPEEFSPVSLLNYQIDQQLEEQHKNLLSVIIAKCNATLILTIMRRWLSQPGTEGTILNYVANFLYILERMNLTVENCKELVDLVSKTSLFTVSFNNSNIPELQRTLVNVTKKVKFSVIPQLVKTLKSHDITYNILRVIFNNFELIGKDFFLNMDFIKNIVHIFFCAYEKQASRVILSDIYLFFMKSIQIQENANICFSLIEFNTLIIFFILDQVVRNEALQNLRLFLLNEQSSISLAFPNSLSTLFHTLAFDDKDPVLQEITNDILEMLNHCLSVRPRLSLVLSCIHPVFKSVLERIGDNPIDYKIIINVIKFTKIVITDNNCDPSVIPLIVKKVMKMNSEAFHDEIQTELYELAIYSNPREILRFSNLLQPLLMRYTKNEDKITFIRMIIEIIKMSRNNLVELTKSKFDEFLLDEIASFVSKDEDNDLLVEAYLDLLTEIHCKIASTASVSKYIKLFAPYEGKYIHPNLETIFNHFVKIIQRSMTEPVPYIPLKNGAPSIEITIKESSFSLLTYMFIEPHDTVTYDSVWTIKMANAAVSLCIQNLKFVFSFNNSNNLHAFPISKSKIGCWFWLAIAVKFEPNLVKLTFIDENKEDIIFPCEPGLDKKIFIGPSNNKNNQPPIAYISKALVMKYDLKMPNIKNKDDQLVAFKIKEVNRKLILASNYPQIQFIGSTESRLSLFPNIFAHVVGFKFLSIIFAEESMKSVFGRNVSDLFVIIFDGLKAMFTAFRPLEVYFLKGECTQLLANFLYSTKLSIELFAAILDFANNIENKVLKEEVFINIVLSINLWKEAPQDVLVAVASYWYTLLEKSNIHLFNAAMPIISVMQEIKLQSMLPNPSIMLLGNYSNIAANMILFDETSYNFDCLVGEIVSSLSAQQAIIMNTIMQTVLNSEKINESHVKDREDCFFLLQSILRIPDEALLIMILDCVILSHTRHIFDTIPLFYHISIVQRMLLPEMISINAINLLSAKTSCTSDLIGILVKMSSQHGQEAINVAAKSLRMDQTFARPELCCFVNELFYYSDRSNIHKYFEFLDNYVPNALELLKMNEIFDIDLLSPYIFHVVVSSLNYDINKVIAMMLFGCVKNVRDRMRHLIEESPFARRKRSSRRNIILSEKVLNMQKINPTFTYDIKIDKQNEWVDKPSAIMILENIDQNKPKVDDFLKDLLIITTIMSGEYKYVHLLSKDPTVEFVAKFFQYHRNPNEEFSEHNLQKLPKYFDNLVFPYEKNVVKLYNNFHAFITNQEDVINAKMQMTKADEFVNGYFEAFQKCYEEFCTNKNRHLLKWNKFVQEFAQKHAPWYQYFVPAQERNTHLMRDIVLVKGVPHKLVANSNFDDHLLASLIRDTGGHKEAEKMMKQKEQSKKIVRAIGIEIPRFDKSPEKMKIPREEAAKSFSCQKVSVTGIEDATLEFGSCITIKTQKSRISFDKEDVQAIYLRTFLQKPTAMEIFLNYVSYFLNFDQNILNFVFKFFDKYIQRSVVYNKPPKTIFSSLDITDKWVNGEITNFEYLICLNKYSGRSFNDPAQYPMMPWVLQDYESENIDLSDPNNYRNLSKPMGALNSERLDILKKNADNRNVGLPKDQWFLYSTGPICPMQVYGYFVRQEPFTSMHIQFQGGKFDNSSRIFKSIHTCFKNATHHLQSFYELTPEFFCSPEFLTNVEHYDLGTGDDGDVKLPPWASSDISFIYMNRKALESDFVSSNLHNWIDLVWGYKQNGAKAVESDNVFDPAMYETFNKDNDLSMKIHTETVRKEVGQIPTQLFTEPHKQKTVTRTNILLAKEITIALNDLHATSWQIVQVDKLNLKLLLFTHNHGDACYKVNLVASDFDIEEKFSAGKSFAKCACKSCDKIMTFDIDSNSVLCYNYFKKTFKSSDPFYGFVNDICTDGTMSAIACDDGTMLVLDTESMQVKFKLNTYGDSPVCIDINTEYDMVVVGTELGSLHFISLYHKAIMRTVYLKGKISIVRVSPGWGFVLVYVVTGEQTFEMKLFTMNGDLIKSASVSDPVIDIKLYSDRSGFDHCVYINTRGKIFGFELFYVDNLHKTIHFCNYPLMKIEYIKEINGVIAFGKKAKFMIVPL